MSAANERLLRACKLQQVDCTPVWLMRQAGRYLPQYRALRAKYSMWQMLRSPELAAQVTLQPLHLMPLDAAIIFADILPPLQAMGLDLEYVEGHGPVIAKPLRRAYDIDILAVPAATETILASTLEAIKLVVAELPHVPVVGFCGAPFTMASYAIEGGGSRNYRQTKTLMYHQPAAWVRLMEKLVTVQVDFLLEQARAGAAALQIFDSWAGLALSRDDYINYVQPFNSELLARVSAQVSVPLIHFSTGTFAYLEQVAACGGSVIAVDWRMPLDLAWAKLGGNLAIMGNLDPMALLAPWPELRYRLDQVLAQAGGRRGHIFNLGHGILPQTPLDNVRRLVDYIHEQSRHE